MRHRSTPDRTAWDGVGTCALACEMDTDPRREVRIESDSYVYSAKVDLGDPTSAVTPTLDGPVLAVLARAARPLTVGEVAALAARGSEIGVRRCVARLVEHGIVRSIQMGRNAVHELNRDHVAAPVAELLAGLGDEVRRRIVSALSTWDPAPIRAALLRPAPAVEERRAGSGSGDIGLWLVHAPRPGELPRLDAPEGGAAPHAGQAAEPAPALADVATTPTMTSEEEQRWRDQVRALQHQVRSWTGGRLLLVEMSSHEEADHRRRSSRLLAELDASGVDLLAAPGRR